MWALGSFIGAGTVPLINSSNQAIWQAKVAADLQGRVFAIRRLIALFVTPIATLLAGPLADFVFEPAMSEPSFLSANFGWLVGYGAGAGMALIIVFCGLAMAGVGVGGYGVRVVRDVESILPDHEVIVEAGPDLRQQLQDLMEKRQDLITQPVTIERDQEIKEISRELRELGRR
jgi:hypothetical protein